MRAAGALLLVSIAAAPAVAHDVWILPSTFRPEPDSTLGLGLRVGDAPPGSPAPRNPGRLVRFYAVDPSGEARPVPGAAGADPAGRLRVAERGVWAVGYRSNDASIELPAERFEAYLEEEGLHNVARLRRERGERGTPGREVYSRSIKALFLAGEAPPGRVSGFDRPLGLVLELVPEANPFHPPAGGELPVRVLAGGQPASGVLVELRHLDSDGVPVVRTSDPEGRVSLPIEGPAEWLLTAVTMRPAPPETGADWQSVWTSLTFESSSR